MSRSLAVAAIRRPYFAIAGAVAAVPLLGLADAGTGFAVGYAADITLEARRRSKADAGRGGAPAAGEPKGDAITAAMGRGPARQVYRTALIAFWAFVAALVAGAWAGAPPALALLDAAPSRAALPIAPGPWLERALAASTGLGERGAALLRLLYAAGGLLLGLVVAAALARALRHPAEVAATLRRRATEDALRWLPIATAFAMALCWFLFASSWFEPRRPYLFGHVGFLGYALLAGYFQVVAWLVTGCVLVGTTRFGREGATAADGSAVRAGGRTPPFDG